MCLITVLMVFGAELQWLWWPHVDLAMCRLLSGMCQECFLQVISVCKQGISRSPPGAVACEGLSSRDCHVPTARLHVL